MDLLLNHNLVFRMNALKDRFHGRLGGSVVSKDSKGLFRPEHLPRRDFATKAAGAAKVLCFGEVRFTSPQVLLSALAVVDIRRQVVDDQTKTFLTLLERRLVALALNHNRGEMRNLLDGFLIVLGWA